MAKTLVYQMYPIAWEKYGGIPAMTEHLYRIKENLGEVDYVWVSPLYLSPRFDHGYDVADYKAIDPRFGTMDDFDKFVKTAKELGMGVLMDLVLNHTSTEHKWFTEHPEYYYWRDEDMPGWHNLFNGGPAWEQTEDGKYYLHLFNKKQADLRWYDDDGELNKPLVQEFNGIVDFWKGHGISGFRLDVPQAINKDFSDEELTLETLIFGDKAIDVMAAVFEDETERDDLFLVMECMDPTFGEVINYYSYEGYTRGIPLSFVMNMLLKDECRLEKYIPKRVSQHRLEDLIENHARNPHFMLDLESHDSPRFLSRDVMDYNDMLRTMFESDVQGICIYQGQEFGLSNPTKEELPDELMLELDAQTAMRYASGESLDALRPLSRANARVPLPEWILNPTSDMGKDELVKYSSATYMGKFIREWKNR